MKKYWAVLDTKLPEGYSVEAVRYPFLARSDGYAQMYVKSLAKVSNSEWWFEEREDDE